MPVETKPREIARENPRDPLTKAIVARGRTVLMPIEDSRFEVGTNNEGKPVYATKKKTFYPNQEVELPLSEVIRLRETGHLIDPDKVMVEPTQGPQYSEADRNRSNGAVITQS